MPSGGPQLASGHRVETLRGLAVAFALLGPKLPRPETNRIGGIELEMVTLEHPELKLGLPLEYPQHDRAAGRHIRVDIFRHLGLRSRRTNVREGDADGRKQQHGAQA